jgi:hypothetical protein
MSSSFHSTNTVPAVINGTGNGHMTIIDSDLKGGAAGKFAIVSTGTLFARNITSSGYSNILDDKGPGLGVTGSVITEYNSNAVLTLFNSPQKSLNLPVKHPPDLPWDTTFGNWVNWTKYKATGRTHAQAMQLAIDAGKPIVYMPHASDGTMTLSGGSRDTFRIRGAVSRLEGCSGYISGNLTIIIEDGSTPVVKLSRIYSTQELQLINRSSRTVVIESMVFDTCINQGTGDFFVSDFCGNRLFSRNPQAKLWARQFNAEAWYNLFNESGTMWIFGWKTEGENTKITLTGGVTEILGFLHYSSGVANPSPMIVIKNDAQFSLGSFRETNFNAPAAVAIYVDETRNGVNKQLMPSATYGRNWSLLRRIRRSRLLFHCVRQPPQVSDVKYPGESIPCNGRLVPLITKSRSLVPGIFPARSEVYGNALRVLAVLDN